MKTTRRVLANWRGFAGIVVAGAVGFAAAITSTQAADPLSSWNDTATKQAIVDFVKAVTDRNSRSYVEPEDRIATFDNDGTMWNEKPTYIHVFAVLDRFKEQMKADPSLAKKEPYKAVAKKDLGYFVGLVEHGKFLEVVGDLMGVPFEGMTTTEFEDWNRNWLKTWKHPRFGVGYQDLIYQPMVELFDYLRANDFKVYLCTADEGAFLQLVSKELYGVPSEQVLGSAVKLKYSAEDGAPVLARTGKGAFLNNWDGKPRLIFQTLGKRPILAGGNSNGDLHMLQYVAEQNRRSLSLLVHHTDGQREYKYNKHTEKVLPLAKKESWTVIDMKNDWKTIFPNK